MCSIGPGAHSVVRFAKYYRYLIILQYFCRMISRTSEIGRSNDVTRNEQLEYPLLSE
jgi:hypothetical protein